jgi:dTDP-4-amino-4,6-dideoxygalactose transaminase
MSNPFAVIEDFEAAICGYTGAPYAVTTNSCTNALFLSLEWYMRNHGPHKIAIPKHTYVSVPQVAIRAGHRVAFEENDWIHCYQLRPLPVVDSARMFTGGMYVHGTFMCCSFGWTKPLPIGRAGAILHDNPEADEWLRRARFDGRLPGETAGEAKMIGWRCLMDPRDALQGVLLMRERPHNYPDAPKSDYPDLSQMEIFRWRHQDGFCS